jgi:branched-subunit amino acid ABC-type transport system permease component
MGLAVALKAFAAAVLGGSALPGALVGIVIGLISSMPRHPARRLRTRRPSFC